MPKHRCGITTLGFVISHKRSDIGKLLFFSKIIRFQMNKLRKPSCPYYEKHIFVSYGDTLPHTVVGVCGEFQRTGRFLQRGIWSQCSTFRGTFCSLITLATPRQDWTGSNPSRREGGGCGFTLSRTHSFCAVRLVYIQISPCHIWTPLHNNPVMTPPFCCTFCRSQYLYNQ